MPATDPSRHPRLYRSIMKKRWYDKTTRDVLPIAFKLKPKDEGKLSVLKSVNCSPGTREQCYAGLNECYGEFVLETARVITLGLEVHDDEPNAVDYSENHASIVGIPENPTTKEDVEQVNDFYAKLAELSRLHYDRLDHFS